jgi:type II secretory pathway pseudopilin PulG
MAIIIAIAVPLLIGHTRKAQNMARESNAKMLYNITNLILSENPKLVDDLENLVGDDSLRYSYLGRQNPHDVSALSGVPFGSDFIADLRDGYDGYFGVGIWPDDSLDVLFQFTGNRLFIYVVDAKDYSQIYPRPPESSQVP